VNGITLLALLVLIVALPFAYRAGVERGRRAPRNGTGMFRERTVASLPPTTVPGAPAATSVIATVPGVVAPAVPATHSATTPAADRAGQPGGPVPSPAIAPVAASPDSCADPFTPERARLIRSGEAEAAALRRGIDNTGAALGQLQAFAADRHNLYREVAAARGDVARYRQLIVELEDSAPPPLLDGPNTPDDLKLIVGVGPVLERMLQKLGIGSYRQIAQWSEHDIDEFDARLPEFRGRIRRDTWVTQARALHQSKYGERA
jgi:predicted flap endonuclease-1-like 5' DNA nuclease